MSRRYADRPLLYSSPNAPAKNQILGKILLIVPSGHRRYTLITAIRGGRVLP